MSGNGPLSGILQRSSHAKATTAANLTGFSRAAILLVGSTALGQGAAVLSTPLITRLYGPNDFGVLAVYVSVLTFCLAVATLRYEFAIPLPKRKADAANLVALGFAILTVMCLFLWGALTLLGGAFSKATIPGIRQYLWLLPLSLFGAGLYQLLTYWALREKSFALVARTRIVQSWAMVVTQLVVGAVSSGPLGLLVGDVLGRSAGGGSLTREFVANRRMFSVISINRMRRVAVRYRKFPMISSGASLLNNLGLQLPSVIIAATYGPVHAGYYALAVRVGGLPADILSQAIGQVFLGEAAAAVRSGRGSQVYRLMRRLVARLFAVATFFGVVAAIGAQAFPVLFGAEWREAGIYLVCLIPMLMGRLTVASVSQVVNIAERQVLQAVWDGARVCAVVAVLIGAYEFGMAPITAIVLYSCAMAIMYVAYLAVYVHIAKRLG